MPYLSDPRQTEVPEEGPREWSAGIFTCAQLGSWPRCLPGSGASARPASGLVTTTVGPGSWQYPPRDGLGTGQITSVKGASASARAGRGGEEGVWGAAHAARALERCSWTELHLWLVSVATGVCLEQPREMCLAGSRQGGVTQHALYAENGMGGCGVGRWFPG